MHFVCLSLSVKTTASLLAVCHAVSLLNGGGAQKRVVGIASYGCDKGVAAVELR